jgi:hypothetical protein
MDLANVRVGEERLRLGVLTGAAAALGALLLTTLSPSSLHIITTVVSKGSALQPD